MDHCHEHRNLALVHGEVIGQGPIEGVAHGHAWCETWSWVIDVSNGRYVRMPAALYYEIGRIGGNVYRYTLRDLRRWVTDTGTWGPWELQTQTGL